MSSHLRNFWKMISRWGKDPRAGQHVANVQDGETLPLADNVPELQEHCRQLITRISELGEKNARLEAQIKERAARLSESEEKYRSVVENGIDGILILQDNVIRYCNPQMLSMLGYEQQDVIGVPIENFVSPGARIELQEWSAQRSAGLPAPTRHENAIVHRDGHSIVVEIHASTMRYEDKPAILAFVRDITKRKRIEQAEREARQVAETLRKIGIALSATLDFNRVLDKLLELLKGLVPYDSGCVLMVEGFQVRPVRWLGYDRFNSRAVQTISGITWNISEIPTLSRMLESKKPLVIPDVTRSKEWIDIAGLSHIRSWVGAPILIRQEVVAFFSLDCCEAGFYTPRHGELLSLYCVQAALALENARLYQELQEHRQHLEKTVADRTAQLEKVLATLEQRVADRTQELSALYNVASITAVFTDIDSMLLQSLQVVLATLKGSIGAVHIFDSVPASQSFMIVPADVSPDIQSEVKALPHFPLLWKKLVGRSQSVLIQQLDADPAVHFEQVAALSEGGYCALIASPIRGAKGVLGVFSLLGTEAQIFTREDTILLSAVADHVGIAIENARLRKEAEQNAIAEERQRLARDLHDSVSQLLYSQVLYADASKKYMQSGRLEQATGYIDQLIVSAHQALKEMRLMIFELRPSVLENEGLVGALKFRLETVEQRSGMEVRLISNLTGRLPVALENDLYYMAQEALNNVVKHARAKTVWITLGEADGQVSMEVRDDGVGFSKAEVREGLGLKGLRERTMKWGGELTIDSLAGQGTSIQITVPEG